MNVIMPVATATMHKDPILAQSSKRTASRAVKVLMTLLDNSETIKNCEAIYTASIHDGKTISGDDNSLVKVRSTFTVFKNIHYVALMFTSYCHSIGYNLWKITTMVKSKERIFHLHLKV